MPIQPHSSPAHSALFAVLAAVVVYGGVGCSAPKTEAYRAPATADPALSVTAGNVRIAIDPIVDPARSQLLFATEPLRKGIFPVHVSLANLGTENTLLVQQSDFELRAADGAAISTVGNGVEYRNKTAEGIGTAGAVLLSPALMFSAGPEVAKAMAVQHNFAEKEFPVRTSLAPGRSAEGFVYFKVPDKQPPARAVIRLTVRALDGSNPRSIELPVTR